MSWALFSRKQLIPHYLVADGDFISMQSQKRRRRRGVCGAYLYYCFNQVSLTIAHHGVECMMVLRLIYLNSYPQPFEVDFKHRNRELESLIEHRVAEID